MVALLEKTVAEKIEKPEVIPSYLVYETLDGAPVYYRGYRKVMEKKLKFEEIMAYGNLQAIFLANIRDFLQSLIGKKYLIMPGETGVHIELGTNPSLDLCVYPKKGHSIRNAVNKYSNVPPKLVIEVDTKADAATFEEQDKGNYYLLKTKKLLDFGVEEMVWIFTDLEKVTIARPNQPWLTVDWKDEIEIMGHRFTIQQIIEFSEYDEEN